jgi:hypothetical protein
LRKVAENRASADRIRAAKQHDIDKRRSTNNITMMINNNNINTTASSSSSSSSSKLGLGSNRDGNNVNGSISPRGNVNILDATSGSTSGNRSPSGGSSSSSVGGRNTAAVSPRVMSVVAQVVADEKNNREKEDNAAGEALLSATMAELHAGNCNLHHYHMLLFTDSLVVVVVSLVW